MRVLYYTPYEKDIAKDRYTHQLALLFSCQLILTNDLTFIRQLLHKNIGNLLQRWELEALLKAIDRNPIYLWLQRIRTKIFWLIGRTSLSLLREKVAQVRLKPRKWFYPISPRQVKVFLGLKKIYCTKNHQMLNWRQACSKMLVSKNRFLIRIHSWKPLETLKLLKTITHRVLANLYK